MEKKEKQNPYSNEGMFSSLYYPILNNWVGLSNVKGEKNNKNFSHLLKFIIEESTELSKLWIEDELENYISNYIENRIDKRNEFNYKSKETVELIELKNRIIKIKNKKNNFNQEKYIKKIKNKVEILYNGSEKIKPRNIDKINKENIELELKKLKSTKAIRLSNFKGLKYKQKQCLHFIDIIEPTIAYYNRNQNIDFLETLIKSVLSYTLRVSSIRNTKKILYKLNEIEKRNLKLGDCLFDFKVESEEINKKNIDIKGYLNIEKLMKNKID